MILDFKELEDGARIDTDLCVIGAGAAGISIAREFAASKVDVLLLESGGYQYEPEAQSLYVGSNDGLGYFGLNITRLRMLGGTTNHWSGRCGTFTDMDFRARSWVPDSGWPISKADLDPFYERAQQVCRLGDYLYDEQAFEKIGLETPAFNPDRVRSRFWQFSPPVRFGLDYRDELKDAANIRLLIHANVTDIRTNAEGAAVEHVKLRSFEGKQAEVRAKRYVLACGGIENPRLLLASNGVEEAGLGNRHDVVGRYFMEHPKSRSGVIVTQDADKLLTPFRKHFSAEVPFWAHFNSGDALQEREQILNNSAALYYKIDPDSGAIAAQDIWKDLKKGEWPDQFGEKLGRTLGDLDDMLGVAYTRYVEGGPAILTPGLIYLRARTEQAPNPQSRITLGDERDALGLRRPHLDWQLTALDKRSVAVFTRTLAEELQRLDLGRVQIADWLLDESPDWADDLIGSHHHMGTTRMSENPRRGVVDGDSRVHGVDNLYVAGSSVFPTGGYMNPTLTIVAMSLRLADHLKQRFA